MRFLAILLLAFFQMPVGGPTQVQDPSYPLRLSIMTRDALRENGYIRMWGRGDMVRPQLRGFDYDAHCSELFMVSYGQELYSGRWKKQDQQIEMLVSKMGTGKSFKCTLKVDLKSFSYQFDDNGRLITKPLSN